MEKAMRMRKKRKIARTEEEKARKRGDILDAAYRMLIRSGYHEATMKKIAREANVSYGTVYWHFKSKEEIFFAVLEKEIENINKDIPQLLDTDRRAVEKIEAMIRYLAGTLGGSADFIKLLFSALAGSGERFERNFEEMVRGMYSAYNDMLENLLITGQKEGDIRQDVDTRAVAVTMVSLLDAIYLQYGLGTATMDTERLADALWDFTMKGVGRT